jgi:hypothetical protein
MSRGLALASAHDLRHLCVMELGNSLFNIVSPEFWTVMVLATA